MLSSLWVGQHRQQIARQVAWSTVCYMQVGGEGDTAANGLDGDHGAPLLEAGALQPASARSLANADRSASDAAV